MIHLFEFIAGFALAMMVELCWHGVMNAILGTPRHIARFFPDSYAGGVKVHLVALVWLMLGIAGAVLFMERLATGAWWQALVISAGAIAWVMYRIIYYRVLETMRAQAKTRLEG